MSHVALDGVRHAGDTPDVTTFGPHRFFVVAEDDALDGDLSFIRKLPAIAMQKFHPVVMEGIV